MEKEKEIERKIAPSKINQKVAAPKKGKEDNDLNQEAGKSARIFCLMVIFALIYGKMLMSTIGSHSGFTQLKSSNITNVTIFGDIDGEFFEKEIIAEARELT